MGNKRGRNTRNAEKSHADYEKTSTGYNNSSLDWILDQEEDTNITIF